MKTARFLILFFGLWFLAAPLHALTLPTDKFFTSEDKLTFWEYEISRARDPESGAWTATLKKDGKVIATFEKGGPQKEMTRFGLFRLRGNKIPQLLVEQYSGGAHCCFSYWIFNLDPDFRILHQSEYPIGALVDIIDLDKDGTFEIIQSNEHFDYFDRLPHVYSPSALVIFQYDSNEQMFVPANNKFSAYLLKDIEKKIKAVKAFNAKTDFSKIKPEKDLEHLSLVVQVVLDYVYAGKEPEAWAFFDQEYRLSDKEEMRGKIKEKLAGDQVYEYIYGRL